MILGNVCTRRCGFCAVQKGGPLPVDYDEPRRVAEAVAAMGLRYAVVTSVNRDDRKDGGAELFQLTIEAIRERVPGCKVEVLVPDFQGSHAAMEIVMNAQTGRAQPQHRDSAAVVSAGAIGRSLRAFARDASGHRQIAGPANTGEVRPNAGPRRNAGRSSQGHARSARAQRGHPDPSASTCGPHQSTPPRSCATFRPKNSTITGAQGAAMGFAHVEAGPLVRSSYHADDSHSAAIC